MAGIDLTGFVDKDYETIKAEIEAAEKAVFGDSVNTLADSVFGQLNGIMTERLVELWLLAKAVYNSQYPDTASGSALDGVASITGVIREAAQQSTVAAIAVGSAGTVLTLGRSASVSGTGEVFTSTSTVTIANAATWAITTAYTVGQIVTNAGNIYYCRTAGTSAGAGGPTTTSSDITDGTVHWRYIAAGTAAIYIPLTSNNYGQIAAVAGTLNTIETPVFGWTAVSNPTDATLGRDLESDPDFRARREDELAAAGDATVEAIRADLLRLSGVTQALVLENTTLVPDVDGIPGKAIECIVQGGVNQTIFDAIFLSKAAGIEAHGTTVGSSTDTMGFAHTIKFTRPTVQNVYLVINVTCQTASFPVDGVAQIQAALANYGDLNYKIGDDVIASKLHCEAFNVSGVFDVTAFFLGFAPAPVGTANLTIGTRELADLDTSRITVNVTLI